MSSAAVALALCRFGQDAAAMLLWGASAYLWALVPCGLTTIVTDRLRPWAAAAIAAAAVSTIAKLPAEVAGIGEGWLDAVDPAMVRSVLIDTSVGQAWGAQAAAALLLVAATLFPFRTRTGGIAVASGLLLASLSLEGHATMHEGWLGALNRSNDVLHVLAGGAWLGALVPVLVILGDVAGTEGRVEVASALRGFSRAGHAAVALVIVSGVASTALVLGRWPVDLSRPYEALLDAKVVCVLVMTGLAIINRYAVVPRMNRDPAAMQALRLGTIAEVPLGLAAIALVAVFGLLDPG